MGVCHLVSIDRSTFVGTKLTRRCRDVLERAPAPPPRMQPESVVSGGTEQGSFSTHFHPPGSPGWQANDPQPRARSDAGNPPPIFGASRSVDDNLIDPALGMMSSLSRHGSRRIDRSMGSLLRRIASEADVDLHSLVRFSARSDGGEDDGEKPPSIAPPATPKVSTQALSKASAKAASNVSSKGSSAPARAPGTIDTFTADFLTLPRSSRPTSSPAIAIPASEHARPSPQAHARYSSDAIPQSASAEWHSAAWLTTPQSSTGPESWRSAERQRSELGTHSSRESLLSRLHARTETSDSTEFYTTTSRPSGLVRRAPLRRRSQSHGSRPRPRVEAPSADQTSFYTPQVIASSAAPSSNYHGASRILDRDTAASNASASSQTGRSSLWHPTVTSIESTVAVSAHTFGHSPFPTFIQPSVPSFSSHLPSSASQSSSSHAATSINRSNNSGSDAPASVAPSSNSHAARSVDRQSRSTARMPPSAPSSLIASSAETGATSVLYPSTQSTASSASTVTVKSKRKPVPQEPAEVGQIRHEEVMRTLRDQEALRLTNAGHVGGQLNRIEQSIADLSTYFALKPPPVPQKDASDPSEPSDSSSDSGSETSTTRPITPSSANPHADLFQIRGTLENIVTQQSRMQQWMEEALHNKESPRMQRLEDLLLRLLVRSGDSEVEMELGLDRIKRGPRSESESNGWTSSRSESLSESIYSDEMGHKAPARPPSVATLPMSDITGVSSSLLAPSPRISEELSEQWELDNLPTANPSLRSPRSRAMAPLIPRAIARPMPEPDLEREASPESVQERALTPQPTPQPPPPISRGPVVQPPSPSSSSSSESTATPTSSPRRRHMPGPPPQPIGLPSPVSNDLPPPLPGMTPFPPAMGPSVARPARLAPPREPITTT